jgi:hypothetical protein
MKTKLNILVAGMFLAAKSSASATVRYVNINSAKPARPVTRTPPPRTPARTSIAWALETEAAL